MNHILDEDNEEVEILTLTDQDGQDMDFEVAGNFQFNGEDYLALFPIEENDSEEEVQVAIFRTDYDENEEMVLTNIDDEEELNAVFSEFQRQWAELEYDEEE